ncbi:MAG: M23 family metallopeptidase [Sphingomonadaceae bacterium]|nr:M23 family metallopeptidase [Sphingomonadaceae bacterium]
MVTSFRAFAGHLTVISCLSFGGPALANSSANADIAAPLRAAQSAGHSVSGARDDQFSKLFNTWQSFESNNVPALAAVAEAQNQAGLSGSSMRGARAEVSIPSRVPLAGLTLTSNFGMRVHPVSGRRRAHKGIDLAAPTGTPIYATGDGLISRASWFSSYGLYVAIEHGSQIQTRYAHMSRLNVAQGQRVHKGDIIGYVGSTGRSTGPHLHYEVRVRGAAVNPIPYMNGEQLAKAGDAKGLGRGGKQ